MMQDAEHRVSTLQSAEENDAILFLQRPTRHRLQRSNSNNRLVIKSKCIILVWPKYKDGKYKVDIIYRTLFLNKSSAHSEVNTSYLEFSIM